MLALLQHAVSLGALRQLDIQLARLFVTEQSSLEAQVTPTKAMSEGLDLQQQNQLMLAIAWLSAEVGSGHVCLPLAAMTVENLFNGRHPELVSAIWQQVGNPDLADWQAVLLKAECVSDGGRVSPFILDNDRFYLQRMWLDEGRVAHFFNQPRALLIENMAETARVLTQLFPESSSTPTEINWQKVAAAIAVSQQVAIISGGPGTGKTTTVAKLLAALILLSQPANLQQASQHASQVRLRITLAAPTGKAAARLTESLGQALESLPLSEEQTALIPREAATIHRLLGVKPNSQQLRYHQDNPLHLDVLVVDEASMIDLPMMARLIAALPRHARLILLGDRDQLASVEAGAVLGDICRFAELGYSADKIQQLTQLTGYAMPTDLNQQQGPQVRDSLCLLRKSYRFDAESGIGQLAQAVNQGNSQQAIRCLSLTFNDLFWSGISDVGHYQALIDTCVEGYRHYLQLCRDGRPEQVLAAFNQFQLLCALRSGPFGVQGLNERIEQGLLASKLIHKQSGYLSGWYAGRPVMINRNDSALNLYNGDIGIALYDQHHELRVYFLLPDGGVRSVQTNRLVNCETAYAMTVHKSQGSEFNHTVLVLPDSYSPLLSRELVYTAVTRARQTFSLFANEAILTMAIKRPTERRSGLAQRLS